jgi:hypothetical protein
LSAQPAADGVLALEVTARGAPAGQDAALYVAVTENKLVSHVARGENSGATLRHDHVVRAWIGPIALEDGAARLQRNLVLPPDVQRGNVDVVAFVQDRQTGQVLQALAADACAGALAAGPAAGAAR